MPCKVSPTTATAVRDQGNNCWRCCAGHHLGHLDDQEQLLHSILNDAVSTLDAQRGAIVLADPMTGKLGLQALASGRGEIPSRPGYSHSLAQRSASTARNRSSATVSRRTRNWPWPRALPKGRWRRSCACCCARRAVSSVCCTSTAGRCSRRSRRMSCTWPMPWRPTSRPESSLFTCCRSEKISS